MFTYAAHTAGVFGVGWWRGGSRILSIGADAMIKNWEFWADLSEYNLTGLYRRIRDAAATPSLADRSVDDESSLQSRPVGVWSGVIAPLELRVRTSASAIYCVDVSPNGLHLLSGGAERCALILMCELMLAYIF